jgi:apolipoprotein N-acyltransferase
MGLGAADVMQVAQAETPHPQPWVRHAVAAVGSGILLGASLPSLDLAPLAWVGFVPLLLVIRESGLRAAFLTGWLSGATFFVVVTYWVVHTIGHYTAVPTPVAVVLLVMMCTVLGLYTAAFAAGVRWMQMRRLPWVYLAPALWVVLEWMRGWFFIGFPWGALGYSQWRFIDLVQIVEVTGVYGLSALLVFFNAVFTAVVSAHGRLERRHMVALSVLTVLMIALPALGRARAAALARRAPAGRIVIGLAQGNIAQDHKWDPAFVDETMARYVQLTETAAAKGAQLVVWPETATPFFFQDRGAAREAVLALSRTLNTYLVFGSPAATFEGRRMTGQRNRAYLVGPSEGEIDHYDKMQLVPFGEYVPFAGVLFFVQQMVEAVGTLAPGTRPTVFEGPHGRFGVLVCYEGIFPWVSRRFVADGADFLVNVTNDAWYGQTAAPYQHLAQATLRAVENRVPLVRAANTGISAIVRDDGRVAWAGPLDQLIEHTEEITWRDVRTFYTRFGDVFVWACVLAVLLAGIAGVRRRPGR